MIYYYTGTQSIHTLYTKIELQLDISYCGCNFFFTCQVTVLVISITMDSVILMTG